MVFQRSFDSSFETEEVPKLRPISSPGKFPALRGIDAASVSAFARDLHSLVKEWAPKSFHGKRLSTRQVCEGVIKPMMARRENLGAFVDVAAEKAWQQAKEHDEEPAKDIASIYVCHGAFIFPRACHREAYFTPTLIDFQIADPPLHLCSMGRSV